MNYKQIIGLIAFVAGIGLVIYGFYASQELAAARADIDTKTGIIPESPIKDIVKGDLEAREGCCITLI